MPEENNPKLKQLRDLIDSNCIMVYTGNWTILAGQGWRWLSNLYLPKTDECIATVIDAQNVHGKLNVTLGHPMVEEKMKPEPQAGLFGLYVRDVDDLVLELQKSLDDIEQLERWVNG